MCSLGATSIGKLLELMSYRAAPAAIAAIRDCRPVGRRPAGASPAPGTPPAAGRRPPTAKSRQRARRPAAASQRVPGAAPRPRCDCARRGVSGRAVNGAAVFATVNATQMMRAPTAGAGCRRGWPWRDRLLPDTPPGGRRRGRDAVSPLLPGRESLARRGASHSRGGGRLGHWVSRLPAAARPRRLTERSVLPSLGRCSGLISGRPVRPSRRRWFVQPTQG